MDAGILYYKPDEYTKDIFKNTYKSLTPKEYKQLTQTGIYGKYNTEEKAIEFALYEVADNRIGLLLISDEEIRVICIESNTKDFLRNYTHYMIITRRKNYLTTLEKVQKEDGKRDYRCISESCIEPKEKITILLEQNDVIKCTVIKDKNGRIIKTKTWENPQEAYGEGSKSDYENDSNISIHTNLDRYLESGKDLPMTFGKQLYKDIEIIKKILKKYHDEQIYEANREKIEVFFNPNPDSSKPKSPIRIRKS